MGEFIQVMTTVGKKEEAQIIARSVVEERLAGCVQVYGPITSTFRWKGKLEVEDEWVCVTKSRLDLYEELEQFIRRAHPYEEPEILATPVVEGSEGYFNWLNGELRDNRKSRS